jgi:hypothetical protein
VSFSEVNLTAEADGVSRWIEHYDLPQDVEKEQIREGVKLFQKMSPKVSHHDMTTDRNIM